MLKLSAPVYCYIELTHNCNNHCVSCGIQNVGTTQDNDLDFEEWASIIEASSRSIFYFCITGGEPTLSTNFNKFVELLNDMRIPFALFTNGRWNEPESILKMLCSSPSLVQIFFSLHGSNSINHDSVTQVNGSFVETCENIRRCVFNNLPVSIDCLITRNNYNDIASMVDFSRSLGAGSLTFSRYLSDIDNELIPTSNQLLSALTNIDYEINNTDYPITMSVCIPHCFFTSNQSSYCLAGTVSCVIDPHGNVRPCVMSRIKCGNLTSTSLLDIWNNDIMDRWRTQIPPLCEHCNAISECRGGCRAAAEMRGNKVDHLCIGSLKKHLPRPSKISLPSHSLIERNFTYRKESFGYVLVSGSQVVPVTEKAMDVLEYCTGESRVQDVYNLFGKEGLDLISVLFQKGLIVLK